MHGIKARGATGGGGSGSGVGVAVAKSQGTAAASDLSTSSTSYVDLGTISESIAAEQGDELEISLTGSVYTTPVTSIDFRFAVAGTRSGPGWRVRPPGDLLVVPVELTYVHTVTAADISSGQVTVKPMWKVAANTGYLVEQTSTELIWQFSVKNLTTSLIDGGTFADAGSGTVDGGTL